MWYLFSDLMSGVPQDQPLVYVSFFVMCLCTFGAFMRFLYTLFIRW